MERLSGQYRSAAVLGWIFFFGCPLDSAEAVVLNVGWSLEDSANAAASEPAFDGVGWIDIQEGANSFRGTGVLVAPNWVLTVAHNWFAGSVSEISFNQGGASYPAVTGAWYQHPDWLSNPGVGHTQGWDIGLVELSLSVPGAVPAPIYSGNAELGNNVMFAGYGAAGTILTGPRPNAVPTLYAARNTIDRVLSLTGNQGDGGLLAMDFDDGSAVRNSLQHAKGYDIFGQPVDSISNGVITGLSSASAASPFEGSSARGDSGGPAFADFGGGYELVGLVSWGVNPTEPGDLYGSGLGDVTYLTRVSAFEEWITQTITIPEPGPTGLVLLGLVMVGLRRSRAIVDLS